MSINVLLDSKQIAIEAIIDEKIKDPHQRMTVKAQVNGYFTNLKATCHAMSRDPRYSQDDIRRRALDSSEKIEHLIRPYFQNSAQYTAAILEKKERLAGLKERVSTAESHSSWLVGRAASSTFSDKFSIPTHSVKITTPTLLQHITRSLDDTVKYWHRNADLSIGDPGKRYLFKLQATSTRNFMVADYKKLAAIAPENLSGENARGAALLSSRLLSNKMEQLHREMTHPHEKPRVIEPVDHFAMIAGDYVVATQGKSTVIPPLKK